MDTKNVEITTATTKETIDSLLLHAGENEPSFGLPVVEVGGLSYAIATNEEERFDAAMLAFEIDDIIVDFDPQFIHEATGLDLSLVTALCEAEDVNGLRELMEESGEMENFVRAVGREYGYGGVLAMFDGEEIKLDCGYYAYLNEA